MKNSSSHTGTIIIVVVVVLAAMAYFYTQGGSAPASGGLVSEGLDGDVGLAEVNLLNQIQSIQINTSLFGDAEYLSLRDYTVDIPSQPIGRQNPFAPIPGVGNPSATVKK